MDHSFLTWNDDELERIGDDVIVLLKGDKRSFTEEDVESFFLNAAAQLQRFGLKSPQLPEICGADLSDPDELQAVRISIVQWFTELKQASQASSEKTMHPAHEVYRRKELSSLDSESATIPFGGSFVARSSDLDVDVRDDTSCNFSWGTIEGYGGDTVVVEADEEAPGELSHKLDELKHHNKKLEDKNSNLLEQLKMNDEANVELMNELDKVKFELKKVKAMESQVETTVHENEQLRIVVRSLENREASLKHQIDEFGQTKVTLEEKIKDRETKLETTSLQLLTLQKMVEMLEESLLEIKEAGYELQCAQEERDRELAEKRNLILELEDLLSELTLSNEVLKKEREDLREKLVEVEHSLAFHLPNSPPSSLMHMLEGRGDDNEISLRDVEISPTGLRNSLHSELCSLGRDSLPSSEREFSLDYYEDSGVDIDHDSLSWRKCRQALNQLRKWLEEYRDRMTGDSRSESEGDNAAVCMLNDTIDDLSQISDLSFSSFRLTDLMDVLKRLRGRPEGDDEQRRRLVEELALARQDKEQLKLKLAAAQDELNASRDELDSCNTTIDGLVEARRALEIQVDELRNMSMEFSSFSDKYKESKERMQELRTEATVSNELYEKEKTRCEYLEEVLVSTKLEHLVDLKEIMQYLETGVQPDQERFFHADEIKSHILHRASALTATTAANEAGPSERRLLSSADGFPSISTVHSSRSPIDPVRATEWRRLAPLNLHSCVAQPFRKLSPLIESDREMACSLLRSQSFQRAIDLGQADDSEDGSKVTSQVTSPMSEAASTIQERPPSATTLSDTSDVEKSTEWNQTCRVQLADEMQRSIVQRKTAFRRNEDNLSEKDSDEYCNINNNNEFEVKSEGDEPHQRGLRHLFNDSSSDTCDSISSPTRDTVSSPDESCDRPFMRASRLTRTPEVDTDASEGDADGSDIKSDILQGIEEISSNNSESIAKFAATRRTRKLTAAPGLSRLQPISDIQESQESFESEVSTAASDSLINSIDSEVSEKEPSQAFSADFIAKLRDISTLTDEAKIEDAFNRLALNFRTDCETVASREEVTSRARELAELNVENEFTLMTAMLNKALGNGELTEEVRESFQELIRCVEILRQSCERVSRTAEFVGVVRQETRASEAVAVMIKFLESLRGVTQRQNAEIRELKNLLQEHNIIPSFDTVFPDLSLGPYAVDARTINRERRLSRTIPMTAARRRQSEAVLPSTSRFGMDMRIQLQNLARRGSIRPRGVSDTDVTEADEPFESTVNRKMPPSRGESTDRESSATDKELKPAAPATSWRAKLRRECLRFCDAVKRRTPFSQRLRLVSLGFGFFLVLLCILLTLFPTGSLAPDELHELSGTLFDRVVHKPLPQ